MNFKIEAIVLTINCIVKKTGEEKKRNVSSDRSQPNAPLRQHEKLLSATHTQSYTACTAPLLTYQANQNASVHEQAMPLT